MKLVLIGYRGTGKSAVGRQLARKLGLIYVGMDDTIVARAGTSIPEIVEKFGWSHFRDMESALAKELSEQDNILVDTGGGVIERTENMAALAADACVIWLQASIDIIVDRIGGETQRPALTQDKSFTEEVAQVLAMRIDKYKNAAHYTIDTDHLSIEDIVNRAIAIWNDRKGGADNRNGVM